MATSDVLVAKKQQTQQEITEKTLVSFDYAIKFLLKHKSDYHIVESFISALLVKQGHTPVKIIGLAETESNKEALGFKKSIADLVVEDTHHRKYLVEIERAETMDFVHKAHFNTCRLVVDKISAAKDYRTIKKVYHISLLYFDVKGDGSIYHGKTTVQDIKSQEKLRLEIRDPDTNVVYDAVDVLPEYLFVVIPRFDDKIKDECDEWMYILKHSEIRKGCQLDCADKVQERLSLLKMNEDERNDYWRYLKDVTTAHSALTLADAKGEARGLAKGRAEGDAKLRLEKLAIAKALLQKKMNIKDIGSVTGLTEAEIKKLKQS